MIPLPARLRRKMVCSALQSVALLFALMLFCVAMGFILPAEMPELALFYSLLGAGAGALALLLSAFALVMS